MNNFEIFSGDCLVAIWENNRLSVINNELLPLFLKRISNAEAWLETRAVDSHRANSRLLKKALRLSEKDDVSTVLHANGVTVTDNYWVRAIGSSIQYSDVTLDFDFFSKRMANLALNGDYSAFNYVSCHNSKTAHELTNVGSFEKCWKMIDGKWWLFKKATHSEQFSEIFVYELAKSLGINAAIYKKGHGVVKTLDFTEGGKYNFEPAVSFMGDNEDYTDVICKLREICPSAVGDYIRMIFIDTIVANPDRHTGNFGLLRDKHTGELLCLAPLFDHNMALISRGYPKITNSKDILIDLFNDVLDNNPDYKRFIPKLDREMVFAIIKRINMRVNTQLLVDFVMGRYQKLNLDI